MQEMKTKENQQKKMTFPNRIIPKKQKKPEQQKQKPQKNDIKNEKEDKKQVEAFVENAIKKEKQEKNQKLNLEQLSKEQIQAFEEIEKKIKKLRPGEELIITSEDIKAVGDKGKEYLIQWLRERTSFYYFVEFSKIISNRGGTEELEGEYIYVYCKKNKRQIDPVERT
jgi:hypothetical protein